MHADVVIEPESTQQTTGIDDQSTLTTTTRRSQRDKQPSRRLGSISDGDSSLGGAAVHMARTTGELIIDVEHGSRHTTNAAHTPITPTIRNGGSTNAGGLSIVYKAAAHNSASGTGQALSIMASINGRRRVYRCTNCNYESRALHTINSHTAECGRNGTTTGGVSR
jgi:lipopolysaccharide biosynthesis regulator YciM